MYLINNTDLNNSLFKSNKRKSDNANLIAGSIRAKLSEKDSKKADQIIDENLKGV